MRKLDAPIEARSDIFFILFQRLAIWIAKQWKFWEAPADIVFCQR
jgi:hypothetical protein